MLSVAWMDLPYLPFIGWLDYIPSIALSVPLVAVLIVSPIAIVLQYRPKLFSSLIGLAIIFMVIASRPLYATNLLFLGCLFLLIGLYRGDDRPFRWQLIILYAAAGLNKALLADWWNGEYMTNFAVEFGSDLNLPLKLVSEQRWIARLLGWATILVELVLLPILLLRHNTAKKAVLIGWGFHVGMLVLTFGKLSIIYLYVASAAYLLIFPLPNINVGASFRIRYRYELMATLYFGALLLWLRAGILVSLFAKLT